jgi:hypothetical protein
MALDPRLASVEVLALAALRLRQRREAEPKQRLTFRVVYYDASGSTPDEYGPQYTYELTHTAGGERWEWIHD